MGGIKLLFIFLLLNSFFVSGFSQEKDTVYILDYFIGGKGKSPFKHGGTLIYLSANDSIKIKATKNSPNAKIRRQKDFHINFTAITIESLRIIINRNSELSVRIFNSVQDEGKYFAKDTTISLISDLTPPYIYWNILREKPKFYKFFNPSYLEFTNEDFAYKKNYLRPKIRAAIMNSVVYEYHYPEGKLIRLKK